MIFDWICQATFPENDYSMLMWVEMIGARLSDVKIVSFLPDQTGFSCFNDWHGSKATIGG